MCSNHLDAVRKKESDRRYAPFFTAQQSRADIEASGMGGDYFPRLYKWLRSDGYAILNGWLRSYQIPMELNPAEGCVWAPETSSTQSAIENSATPFEQDIYESIAEGTQGFQGGWISSIALRRLAESRRFNISARKCSSIIEGMGYVRHPSLSNGRAGAMVAAETGRPVLYIKRGSMLVNIVDGGAVVERYCRDQGFPILGDTSKIAAQ